VNVWEALQQGRRLLSQVSDEGDIEAEMMLRQCLSLDRTRLYARLGEVLSTEEEEAYRGLIVRRLVYEPTAYILGHREFFGLEFEVTPAAIIPRPETELLVEIAIEFLRRQAKISALQIADVGTGCGVIAVSIAHSLPEARITAVDSSADALALAQRNAERHRVQDVIEIDADARLELGEEVVLPDAANERAHRVAEGRLRLTERGVGDRVCDLVPRGESANRDLIRSEGGDGDRRFLQALFPVARRNDDFLQVARRLRRWRLGRHRCTTE